MAENKPDCCECSVSFRAADSKGGPQRSKYSRPHPSNFRTALYLSVSTALVLSPSVVHLLCPLWVPSRYPTQCQGLRGESSWNTHWYIEISHGYERWWSVKLEVLVRVMTGKKEPRMPHKNNEAVMHDSIFGNERRDPSAPNSCP